MFRIFEKRVRITLLDAASGARIGRLRLALSELPDSFLETATLEIGTDRWLVVAADPPFKRLFAGSRRLTLKVRRLERLDAREILYLLPTIADDLAPSEGPPADGSETLLQEDDWRQIEFLSRGLETEIRQEIAEIRAIQETARAGIGFAAVHLRMRVPEPLGDGAPALEELARRFGPAAGALRFDGSGRRLSRGFCYDLGGGWLLYGVAAAGRARVLAIGGFNRSRGAPATHLREDLNGLARARGLYLVDWCRCIVAEPDSVEFAAVFSPLGD